MAPGSRSSAAMFRVCGAHAAFVLNGEVKGLRSACGSQEMAVALAVVAAVSRGAAARAPSHACRLWLAVGPGC